MRIFTQLRPSFWTGTTGRQIRAFGQECQITALYLISAPTSHALGLYYLPLQFLAHETGLKDERVRESIEKLRLIGFCDYDYDNEFVFVVNMARFQIGEELELKDKQVVWVWKEMEKLRGRPFFERFVELYGTRYKLEKCFQPEGPSKPHRSTENEIGNLEKEKKNETEYRDGEGVARENQARCQTTALQPTQSETRTSDIEVQKAQRRLVDRRALSKKLSGLG